MHFFQFFGGQPIFFFFIFFWIWTSKIIPDLWLLDLFCLIKNNFHTPPYCTPRQSAAVAVCHLLLWLLLLQLLAAACNCLWLLFLLMLLLHVIGRLFPLRCCRAVAAALLLLLQACCFSNLLWLGYLP